MTRTLTIFSALVAMSATLAFSGPAHAEDTADTNAILTIEHNMTAAQTVEEVTKYVSDDIVFDDVTPGQVSGITAFTKDIAAQFAAVDILNAEIDRIKAVASPTVAFAYSLQTFTLKIKATGQTVTTTIRQTDGYRKENGKWLMVYQHLSVPYDPKTGMAVTNEKP